MRKVFQCWLFISLFFADVQGRVVFSRDDNVDNFIIRSLNGEYTMSWPWITGVIVGYKGMPTLRIRIFQFHPG